MKRSISFILLFLLITSCGSGNNLGASGSSLVESGAEVPTFESGEDFAILLNTTAEFSGFTNTNLTSSSDSLILNSSTIMETGRVTLTNTIDGGHSQTINLTNTFTDPVVIAHIMTNNDSDTVAVRVRNVTSTNFEIFMEEPDDSTHASEQVSYMVFEKGEYTLSNGVLLEADSFSTTANHIESGAFETNNVSLGLAHAGAPSVFSSLNSYNNSEFKASLVSGISSTNFGIQQETLGSGSSTTSEEMAWVAVSNFSGTIQGSSYEIETASCGSCGVTTNAPAIFNLSSFSSAPNIISDGRTGNGVDGYFSKGSGTWSSTSYGVYAWEDVINDGERSHTGESFSMLAVEDSAQINLFETSASFETPVYDISNILNYDDSEVNFSATTGSGVSLTMEYALSTDSGSTWGAWTAIASGGEMSLLSGVADFSTAQVKFRGTVTSTENLSSFSLQSLEIIVRNLD